MRRPIAATTVGMLLGCATVASLVAPLASAEDDATTVASADDSVPNTAPSAVDDDAVVTAGGSVVIDVLANDSDPDGDPLTLVAVRDAPMHGTTTPVEGGVEYLAAPGYTGPDSFTYEISDGELTAVATVSLTVTSDANAAPVASDDSVTTRWGSPVTVDVTANDSDADGDPLSVVRIWRPEHGGAQLVDGQVLYTPRGQFIGVDTVRYQVDDGRGGVAEAVLAVQVDPEYRVELKRTSTPVALRPMTVHGTVSTRLGGPVTVTLQRRAESGVWRTLRSQRLRAENQFALSWTPPRPGREWLRLRATWTEGVTDFTVAYRAQVEARFAPVVEPVRRDDVPHTWRPGCPVGPAGLRQIHMSYWDYQGRLRRGTLIGAAWVVSDYLAIFRRAFDTGFPIKKMYPADRYRGVDERAMRAGNTSAFNCRHVTGNPYRMSQHSYGNAIDINTFENPYVTGSRVYPPKAAVPYYHRREHNLRDPGVITRRSSIARELWRQGWSWGARWSFPDYQHWSSNGG